MNKDIMRACGFGRQVDLVEAGFCPMCNKKVILADFVNEISRREFEISGMCQSCQNKIFNTSDKEF